MKAQLDNVFKRARVSITAAGSRGRVYDPCCGSSGMFVQSVEFIRLSACGHARAGAHASGNGNRGERLRDDRRWKYGVPLAGAAGAAGRAAA